MLTVKPRLSRRQPMEEAATPLPSEETTPPVTNIYFGAIRIARVVTRFTTPDCSYLSGEATQKPHHRIDVQTIMGEQRRSVNSKSLRRRATCLWVIDEKAGLVYDPRVYVL